jgi:hypothetical protein
VRRAGRGRIYAVRIIAKPEIALELRVPYFGSDIDKAIPELETYLRGRYPEVETVHIRYRNPRPDHIALVLGGLHDAWIVIGLFTPFARKVQERLGNDIYDWLKKRFKGILIGHKEEHPLDVRTGFPITKPRRASGSAKRKRPYRGRSRTRAFRRKRPYRTGRTRRKPRR